MLSTIIDLIIEFDLQSSFYETSDKNSVKFMGNRELMTVRVFFTWFLIIMGITFSTLSIALALWLPTTDPSALNVLDGFLISAIPIFASITILWTGILLYRKSQIKPYISNVITIIGSLIASASSLILAGIVYQIYQSPFSGIESYEMIGLFAVTPFFTCGIIIIVCGFLTKHL